MIYYCCVFRIVCVFGRHRTRLARKLVNTLELLDAEERLIVSEAEYLDYPHRGVSVET